MRQKYCTLAQHETQIIADARCPMAVSLLRTHNTDKLFHIADIEPILIHAARELAQRGDLMDRPKLITTPCTSLATMGNALSLKNTSFIAWNALLQQWNDFPPIHHTLDKSPIPPGFFDANDICVKTVTGPDAIAAYSSSCPSGKEQLTELLYCPDGCHNGDGVQFTGTISGHLD